MHVLRINTSEAEFKEFKLGLKFETWLIQLEVEFSVSRFESRSIGIGFWRFSDAA